MYVYNPEFDMPDADERILGGQGEPTPEELEQPELPPLPPEDAKLAYLHNHLYATPSLTEDEEQKLFRTYNFCKYGIHKLQEKSRSAKPSAAFLGERRRLQHIAVATENRIIEANLRLVVKIARHHARRPKTLNELIDDGTRSLMRAIETFDYAKGVRFSTYASHAIRVDFAKRIAGEDYAHD